MGPESCRQGQSLRCNLALGILLRVSVYDKPATDQEMDEQGAPVCLFHILHVTSQSLGYQTFENTNPKSKKKSCEECRGSLVARLLTRDCDSQHGELWDVQ